MRKRFSLLALTGFVLVGIQAKATVVATMAQEAAAAEEKGFSISVLKEKFIEGGVGWMALPLVCLILGLAFAIERILYLNAVDVNTDKLVSSLDDALQSGGVEEAKEVARNAKGPVASIAYQAMLRTGDGQSIEDVEKSVVGYGGVEIGKLERNLSWIGLFIAIAPMLGFMGTVVGMIMAFDDIQAKGSVQAQDMAGNIKVALLTTLAGLIVAIILQIFYNYLSSKVDSIVNKMEDASISVVDMLVRYKK